MELIANRNGLLEALTLAGGIAASRTPKPVLQCVRLSATGEGLLVLATDLEVSLRFAVEQVQVVRTGEALVPAEKLSQIVRESADETLSLELDGDALHVKGADSHFVVYGRDPADFPPVAVLEGAPDVEIGPAVLRKLIEKTVYAAARENTRYAINGVLWEKAGKKLHLVATDGRRLARASGSADKTVGQDVRVIVPLKLCHILIRTLNDSKGGARIKLSSNQLVCQCGPATVSSVLVEGHFPEYGEVVPKDCDKKVAFVTEELHSALRRAALLTNEQSKGVRMSLSEGKLVLSSRAPDQGEATISMQVNYATDAIEIGFNPHFLIDALKVVEDPEVEIELKGPDRPGILRAGADFLYVVMPVNLS